MFFPIRVLLNLFSVCVSVCLARLRAERVRLFHMYLFGANIFFSRRPFRINCCYLCCFRLFIYRISSSAYLWLDVGARQRNAPRLRKRLNFAERSKFRRFSKQCKIFGQFVLNRIRMWSGLSSACVYFGLECVETLKAFKLKCICKCGECCICMMISNEK